MYQAVREHRAHTQYTPRNPLCVSALKGKMKLMYTRRGRAFFFLQDGMPVRKNEQTRQLRMACMLRSLLGMSTALQYCTVSPSHMVRTPAGRWEVLLSVPMNIPTIAATNSLDTSFSSSGEGDMDRRSTTR